MSIKFVDVDAYFKQMRDRSLAIFRLAEKYGVFLDWHVSRRGMSSYIHFSKKTGWFSMKKVLSFYQYWQERHWTTEKIIFYDEAYRELAEELKQLPDVVQPEGYEHV